MRDDMPVGFDEVWRSGVFVGDTRPVVRVTIQKPQMRLWNFLMKSTFRRVPQYLFDTSAFNPYPSGIDPTKGEPVTQTYADYLFSAPSAPVEFPNVRSVSFSRSTDVDAGQATITFWNTRPLPVGQVPERGDFDQPGFYSPGRGRGRFSGRWGHQSNVWSALMQPDNIVRVYQGYGSDVLGSSLDSPDLIPPERDSKLVLTGTWHIDDVDLSSDGTITVTARDMGRLLLDQMAFLPVVPKDFYPLEFEQWGDVTVQSQYTKVTDTRKTGFLPFKLVGTGNDKWPESAYLGADRHGHKLAHAADGKLDTYWLSVGNGNPTWRSSYEYIDIQVGGYTVQEIRLRTVKSNHIAWISVKQKGSNAWVAGKTMPYHQDGRGRYEEGVPYIRKKALGDAKDEQVIPVGVKNVSLIRLWLNATAAFNFPGARYRAAIREIQLWGESGSLTKEQKVRSQSTALTKGPAGSNPGRIQDFTDIVKLACAWSGLYWPSTGYVYHSDGSKVSVRPSQSDSKVLGGKVTGRVWGDFEQTGTVPLALLSASNFDKRSMRDVINYVADMIGFLFFVDETGGAVWRMANVWEKGSWVSGLSSNPRRVTSPMILDENVTIMDLRANLTSRNVREGVFVANAIGGYAEMVAGYNPNDTGLRRVAGYTDSNFQDAEEARVMADLITVRQLFKYRTDTIMITANPAIQIDDQVQPFERVTSEGFVHYVKGIQSDMDVRSGKWTMQLQTHWLGDDPEGKWAVRRNTLNDSTVSFVDANIGKVESPRRGVSL